MPNVLLFLWNTFGRVSMDLELNFFGSAAAVSSGKLKSNHGP